MSVGVPSELVGNKLRSKSVESLDDRVAVVRISYRVTSVIVVVTYLLLLLSLMEQVAGSSRPASPKTRASEFDPCIMMWEQIPFTVRIATLVWFPSFLVLLVHSGG